MHLIRPFYGRRRILDWLQDEGHKINRKRVQRLMQLMGISAIYPKCCASKPGKGNKIYPYLLRNLDISMDGRGRWIDDVFVERLWRSVKYEEVYLKAYEAVAEARTGIGTYFEFYNSERRHQPE